MPTLKLNARTVARLPAPDPSGKQVLHFDAELKGFGVLCSGTTNTRTYIVQRAVNGKPRRVTVGACNQLSLDEARAAAADLLHQMRLGQDPKAKVRVPTLQSALDDYLAARQQLAPNTIKMYRQIERLLKDWMPLELHQISGDMVEAKHRALAAAISSGGGNYKGHASANFAMTALGIVWNYASDRHADLPQNPVRRLKRGGMFPEPRRTRMVMAAQLPAFYEAVCGLENPVVKDWMLLLLFTGLRRTEAAALRWEENVDLQERMIRLPASATKAKRALTLPMSDFVHSLLVARRALGDPGGFVFPGRRYGKHFTGNVETFAVIERTTGIRLSAHDLRRTFASVATETEISPFALKAMLNHSSGTDVTAGYVFLSPVALRAAVQKVCDRMTALCGITAPVSKNVRKMTNKVSA